jgi:hypothetical protein
MSGQDFMDAEAAEPSRHPKRALTLSTGASIFTTSLMHVTEALVDRHWQNENAIYNYVYPDTQDELYAYYDTQGRLSGSNILLTLLFTLGGCMRCRTRVTMVEDYSYLYAPLIRRPG